MSALPPPALEVAGLTVTYRRGQQALDAVRNVSLRIAAGQAYGLVGESGSGKSTLALAIMQYLPENGQISAGTIRLAGQELAVLASEQMREVWREQVKLVPQDPGSSLNPSLRVGDQLDEALRDLNEARADVRERSLEQLRQVRIADPERVAASYPHQLSGGMQQRVLIAMALARQPSLLILDEPTTNLDVTTEAAILDLVRELGQSHQTAMLYVSHNLSVVTAVCDRVAVLYAGELIEDLTPQQLRGQPLHPYTVGLLDSVPRGGQRAGIDPLLPIAGNMPRLDELPGGCVFAPRCPIALQLCYDQRPELEATPDRGLVRCHRWREIQAGVASPHASRPAASRQAVSSAGVTALATRELVKHFEVRRSLREMLRRAPPRVVHAVDDVTLQIGQRRTLGLVGESGSGKTTTARCIVGLVERTGGEVMLFDVALAPGLDQRDAAVLRRLQMVFQNPEEALNPHRTVGDVLQRPLERLMGLSKSEARQQAGHLLEAVRLSPSFLDRTPGQLSGGEKQRVAIARAFASNPDVLILDESVSALDVSVQASILNLLSELQSQQGSAYLFISHDLAAVSYLADEIAVMYLAQVVEIGPTEEVLQPPFHPYTEALLSAAPRIDAAMGADRIRLPGDLPSAIDLPAGCRFHTRCPRLLGDICRTQEPPWQQAAPDHRYRCHIAPDDLATMQQAALVAPDEQITRTRRETGVPQVSGSRQ